MISYEFYKVLHLSMILILISSLGFIVQGDFKTRQFKIAIGLCSFLVFTGGMGLIARLGFGHGQPFPFWINAKIGLWVLVNIILIMIGRIPHVYRKWLHVLLVVCAVLAAYLAVNKPIFN